MNPSQELIESSKIIQTITERLEASDPNTEDGFSKFNMEGNLMKLILDLYNSEETEISSNKLNDYSISEVLAYLQASHKYYLSKKLPEIEQTMLHIQNKYSESHQVLTALTMFFNDYKNRFVAHIRMEEKEFFPFIKKMILASKGEVKNTEIKEILNNYSVESFDDGHDPIEDDLKEVSKIIKSFSGTKDTPMPYAVFQNQVELFELELRKHAIIEDHILVPMAKELEKSLRG